LLLLVYRILLKYYYNRRIFYRSFSQGVMYRQLIIWRVYVWKVNQRYVWRTYKRDSQQHIIFIFEARDSYIMLYYIRFFSSSKIYLAMTYFWGFDWTLDRKKIQIRTHLLERTNQISYIGYYYNIKNLKKVQLSYYEGDHKHTYRKNTLIPCRMIRFR